MRGLLFLAAGLAGCAGDLIHLSLPDTAGAMAGLMAFLDPQRAGGVEEVVGLEAIDLVNEPLSAGHLSRSFEDPIERIELLLYELSLERLRLESGPVQLTDAGEGRALSVPNRVLGIDVSAEGAWVTLPERSAAVDRLRVKSGPPPCVDLAIEEVVLPGELTTLRMVMPVDDQSALVQLNTERYRVFMDGRVETIELEIPTSTALATGFRAIDGELWIADYQGDLFRGSLERGFARVPGVARLPGATGILLDGTRTGTSAEELYYYLERPREEGLLQRYAAGIWSEIARISPVSSPGQMIWTGRGKVLTFGHSADSVVLEHSRGQSLERPIPYLVGRLVLMRWTPTLGTIFVSDLGLMVRADEQNDLVELGGQLNTIADVAPLDNGILFGGWRGQFSQYHDGEFCPILPVQDDHYRSRILAIGEGFVLPRRLADSDPASVAIMRRRVGNL